MSRKFRIKHFITSSNTWNTPQNSQTDTVLCSGPGLHFITAQAEQIYLSRQENNKKRASADRPASIKLCLIIGLLRDVVELNMLETTSAC